MREGRRWEGGKGWATASPRLAAGFKWQPEMCPIAKAMVSTVRPKARATPEYPMPTLGTPAAITAAPHPPNTSQKVPKNSAAARLPIGIELSLHLKLGKRSKRGLVLTRPED